MIDLETMSTETDALITSIAIVRFDPRFSEVTDECETMERFEVNVDMQSCQDAGLRMDADTIQWWLKQDPKAIAAMLHEPVPLKVALLKVSHFLRGNGKNPIVSTLWAKSPSFDLAILHNAYKAMNQQKPWPFYIERDVRTLQHLAWPDGDAPKINVGTKHSALDDSLSQALVVQLGYRKLGLAY